MKEMVNPYIAGAPVTETRMFFGREDVFDWIQNSLTGRYADHILVIHGQRRVGKTSVLKQLGNRLPKQYIPVFFDLQGRTHTTLDRFLWWLAREIVRVLKQERGIEFPLPEKEAFAADLEYFENQFLSGLHPVLNGNTLLLTFDEFDNLEESEIKEVLGHPLIDYLRRMMGNRDLNFIFSIGSSGRKLENMQASYTEFFKTALYKKISFLNEEQTHKLIAQPVEGILEYDRAALNRIYRIASGHPYFTQLTCHELFARCQQTDQRRVQEEDVEAVLEDVVERGTVNLKFVWDEASDIEKWALASLAHLDKADNRKLADQLRKQNIRFSETELTSGLLHLREKDILTPENRFVIHLLRLWLQKNRPIEQVREELTEVNPIANRYIEIGMEFKNSGQYEKAIESFLEALAVSTGNVQAQVNIALTYMDQKAYDKAVIEFEKALTIDDEEVTARAGLCEAHLALGNAAMEKGRMKEAAQSYQRVLAINEEHTEARQRMAEIQRQRAEKALTDGRDEDALNAFAEALKYTPEDETLSARVEAVKAEKKARVIAIQVARSEKEVGAKNWEAAIHTLEEARQLAPDDPNIQKRLEEVREKLRESKLVSLRIKAQAAGKSERFGEAMKTWQEYLSLKPQDREKAEEEIERLKKSLELEEIYNEAQRAIAEKHFDQAISLLKQVIVQDENFKDTSRLLAQAIEMRRTRRPVLPMGKVVRIVLIALGTVGILAAGIFAWLRFGDQFIAMLSKPKGEKVCMITGGNAITADYPWDKQIRDAIAAAEKTYGIEAKSYIPKSQFDYIPTIETMVRDGCGYIIASSTLLKNDILTEAGFYPNVKFSIVDYWYGDTYGSTPVPDNLTSLTFQNYESSYLAGYLAAGMTTTNAVGMFGDYRGQDDMDKDNIKGFVSGVDRYNSQNGTQVAIGGWDGDLNNLDQFVLSKDEDPVLRLEALLKDGAGIVFIVGDLAVNDYKLPNVARDNKAMLIGYNIDWENFKPTRDVILTSVVRNPGIPVTESIKQFVNGTLQKGTIEGTLENGGVGLAPYYEFEDVISSDLITELEQLKQEVIATSTLEPTIQIALDTIKNEAPIYQTSFDSWEFGDPIGNARIENGKLIVTSENMDDIPGANVSNLSSDRYAVEYEFRILGFASSESMCGSNYTNDSSYGQESWRQIFTGFNSLGQVILGYYKYPDQFPIIADVQTAVDFSETHTVTLIIFDDQITAFLDGQFLYHAQNPVGSAIHTYQQLSAAGQNNCEFDNYKYWDLSGVDFSGSIGTATITPAPTITPSPASTIIPLIWEQISTGQEFPRDEIVSTLIDENDTNVMYVGTRNAGVYKSVDGGSTWQPDHDPVIRQKLASAVFTFPDYDTSSSPITIRTDAGVTYQYRMSAFSGGRILEISENGKPWEYHKLGCTYLYKYTQNRAYTICDGRLYTLPGLNQVGTKIPIDDPEESSFAMAVAPQSQDVILIGGKEGLLVTKDRGATWQNQTSGIGNTVIELKISPDGTFFAQDSHTMSSTRGSSLFTCTLYKSRDGGYVWESLLKREHSCGLTFGVDGGTLYWNDEPSGVLRSTDNGENWRTWGGIRQSGDRNFGFGIIVPHPRNNQIFYSLGDINNLQVTIDDQMTWFNPLRQFGEYPVPLARLYFDSGEGSEVYLVYSDGGLSGGVYHSSNYGETWSPCAELSYPPSLSDTRLVIDPRDSQKVFLATSGGILFSKSGCTYWSVKSTGIGYQSVNTLAIDVNHPDTLYAGTDSGAYVSFDNGETWVQINDGLPDAAVVYSIVVDREGNVYAATSYGIFKLEQR